MAVSSERDHNQQLFGYDRFAYPSGYELRTAALSFLLYALISLVVQACPERPTRMPTQPHPLSPPPPCLRASPSPTQNILPRRTITPSDHRVIDACSLLRSCPRRPSIPRFSCSIHGARTHSTSRSRSTCCYRLLGTAGCSARHRVAPWACNHKPPPPLAATLPHWLPIPTRRQRSHLRPSARLSSCVSSISLIERCSNALVRRRQLTPRRYRSRTFASSRASTQAA